MPPVLRSGSILRVRLELLTTVTALNAALRPQDVSVHARTYILRLAPNSLLTATGGRVMAPRRWQESIPSQDLQTIPFRASRRAIGPSIAFHPLS